MLQNMLSISVLLLPFLQLCLAYHIQFLVPIKKDFVSFDDAEYGKSYAHGLTIAIDDVNNDPAILPGYQLTYSWIDSTDSDVVLRTMYKAKSFKNESIDVFIGPASKCHTPAKIAEALNIPMLSYHCSEEGYFTKQEYPLFIQTYPNTNSQAALALNSLLTKQGWTIIGIIYEEGNNYWTHFKDTILKRSDILVAASHKVPRLEKFTRYGEYFLEFPEMMQRNQSLAKVRQVLTDLAYKKQVEVFVLLTSFEVLIEIMAEANDLGLYGLREQHRTFVGFQLDVKTLRTNYVLYPEMFYSAVALSPLEVMFRAKRGARSLLIISAARPPNTDRYKKFRRKLIDRTEKVEPFKDKTVFDHATNDTHISEIASSLYDAVYQYALALHRLHQRNATITPQRIVEEFRSHPYESMNGYTSVFSEKDGVLKSHLNLLCIDERITKKNFRNVHVKTIGTFNYSLNSTLNLVLFDEKTSWQPINHTTQELAVMASGYSGLKYNPIIYWIVCFCMAYFSKSNTI